MGWEWSLDCQTVNETEIHSETQKGYDWESHSEMLMVRPMANGSDSHLENQTDWQMAIRTELQMGYDWDYRTEMRSAIRTEMHLDLQMG